MQYTERDVEDCVCLHRQLMEWTLCPHNSRHLDLAEGVIRFLQTEDPVTIKAVRAGTSGRRAISVGSWSRGVIAIPKK